MLVRASGKPKIEFFLKTASTVFKNGSPVQLSSGQLIEATATSTKHVGIILTDVATTDADYASATSKPVDCPDVNDIFEADVKSGVTATVAEVGGTCDFYVDSSTKEIFVDTGTDTHHQVTIVGFISASKVLVKFNSLTAMLPAA